MPTTYTLASIHDAVTIATTLTRSWFRGHATPVGELTPTMFRTATQAMAPPALQPQLELEIIERFKRDAPTLVEGHPLPPDDDNLAWLYLMQHYRAPTRLLDWTEHALVATYFAVAGGEGVDGELWGLNPSALNRVASPHPLPRVHEIGIGTPLVNRNPVVRFFTEEPYWSGSREDLARHLAIGEPPHGPIAIEPRRGFRRMIAQASVFTLHSSRASETIPAILHDERHLVRYLLPAAAKPAILRDLRAIGFDNVLLFPDLEGLARDIVAGPPERGQLPKPPACSGPVT